MKDMGLKQGEKLLKRLIKNPFEYGTLKTDAVSKLRKMLGLNTAQ